MKVGFFIKGQEELFSNGCNQQALFVYQTFMEIEDMECLFFTYKTKTNNFLGIPTYDIKEDENLLLSLDILIFLSNSFSEKGLIKKLKLANVSLVDYNCGNILYILKEDIIFGKHNYITENLIEKMRNNDQYWVIPNYSKDIHFYKSLCRDDAKVYTAPYVWNTDILKLYTKSNDISWCINNSDKEKYIIVAEPNMQITKNCLMPLLICNDLYKTYRNIKVMVLCKPGTKTFEIFCKNLQIHQDNKVEYYPRIQFYEVLRQLKEKQRDVFILSHHKDNPLNFLHLETLYLNYPLIHNCERYTNAGYYYKTIQQASLKLREAMMIHANNINNYKTETQKVLYTFSPKNPTNQFIYKRYLDELMENKIIKNVNEKIQKNEIVNRNIKVKIEKKKNIFNFLKYKEKKIKLVSLLDDEYSKKLWEEILIIHYIALKNKGYNVEKIHKKQSEIDYDDESIYILYGYHLFNKLPKTYIIYQTEQLCAVNKNVLIGAINKYYAKALAVLEYSYNSKKELDKYLNNVYYLPILNIKGNNLNKKFLDKTIDLLWIGNIAHRRVDYFKKIESIKDRIKIIRNGIWGEEKDNLFNTSKILIDIGMREPSVSNTNIIKFQHAFINKTLIITELNNDIFINNQIKDFVIFVKSPEEMIEKVMYYLENEKTRQKLTEDAYNWFISTNYDEYIK